ncbi:MAG: PAS domain S-box protein [Nitrospirota bacterium]|nr:PAS domain S-box protein [Nitrospirota bacterium]
MVTATDHYSVLVVEDNPDLVIGLQDLLHHDGYAVTVAGTVAGAIELVRAHRFNAILLDLGLPDGDGLEVLKETQRRDPSLPVVIVTAHISTDRTVGSLTEGAFAYLTKPYHHEELRQTLRRAIGVKDLAVKVERVQHLLSESEDRFRSLVESATDAIIVANGQGLIVSWNRSASKLFGYTGEEAIGKPLTIIMPQRYRLAHEQGLSRMESTGKGRVMGSVIELHGLKKDGTEFPIELSLATWRNTENTYYSGIIRDISERKKTEQALAQLQRQHSLILTQAGEGIYGLDRRGHTTFVNPSAAAMLGYKVEELSGCHMHSVLHHSKPDGSPYPAEECPIYASTRDGLVHRVNNEVFWRKDGTSFPVEYTSTPICEGDEVVGAVLVFRDMTEQKEAQRVVEESQERFRQLAEHIKEVFWITDPMMNRMIYISPGYEEIWMRSCESLYASPRSWLEAIHPEDRHRILEAALNKHIMGTYDEQYRILRPDGSVRWIWDRAFPIRDDSGVVYRVVGLAEDITDYKQVEAALLESERRYRALFDDNPSMYFMVDSDGTVLSVNRSGADRLGYQVDDLLGQSVFKVFYEPDCEAVRRNLQLCLSNPGRPMCWEVRKVRKDGTVICVRETAQGVCNEKQVPVVLIVCEDITAVKEAEHALRDSEEFKNQILRSSADCIKVLDLEGRIQFMNEAGRALFEISDLAPLVNTPWTEFWEGDNRDAALRALAAAKAGEIGKFIGFCPTATGNSKWWDVQITPIVDAHKIPVRLVAISRDITGQRKAQEALQASEERQELVIRGSNDGYWDGRMLPGEHWSSPRTPIWWSPRVREMLGYTEEEFPDVLESWTSRLHPEDTDRVFAALTAHIERRDPYDVEYRLLTKAGEYRWFRARGQAIWDETGRMTRMAGSLQCVTDRKRAEDALRRSEQLLRDVVNKTTAVIYVKYADGRYLLTNRRFEELFNLTTDQIVGHTDHEIFPKDFAEAFRANDVGVLERNTTVEYEEEAPHPDGPHTYISIKFPLCDHTGKPYATCGISTDITQRKRIEHAIHTHEEQLRHALASAEVGTWDWDLQTGRFLWSSQVGRFLGLSDGARPRTQNDWLALVYREDRESMERATRQAMDQPGTEVAFEHRVMRPDGSFQWCVWTGEIIRDHDGKALHILGTVRATTAIGKDVLEQRRGNA